MKKRWMVQAFALALTGVLVFGTGTVTYADEKKPVVIGEMVGQDTSDKDNAKNTKEGKDASGKECDQCQDPVYTWTPTDSGYTCKAVRECKDPENGKKHYREETAKVEAKTTKQATCEEDGEIVYTATFENKTETDKKDDAKAEDTKKADSKAEDTKKADAKAAESGLFKTQTQAVKINALGHKYGEVTYTWNQTDNGYTCTASRVCENDSSHSETETVEASMEVTKAPTCEEEGEEVYTAVFTNEAFETQTQTVEIGALGHLYGEASYQWTKTDKGYTCTATRICQNDNTHVDKEAVAAAVEVAKAATCEEKGEETYTAVFTNKAFKTQTKTVETDALGHLYGEVSYKWTKEDKGYSCTASRVCENDKNHVEKETVTAAYKVITKATSDKAGEGLYTAAFKNAAFEEQSKKVKLVAADKKDNTKKKTTTKKNTANKTTTKKTAAKTTAKKSTAKKSTAVKTGDENKPVVMGIVAIGALAVIVVAGRQLRKKHE